LVSVRKVPGYLGTTTIMGTSKDSTVRHIIHRFRDKASLEAWENSQELHELAEEGNKYSTPYLQKATGLETWFAIPDLKANVPPPQMENGNSCVHWSIFLKLSRGIRSHPFTRTATIAF